MPAKCCMYKGKWNNKLGTFSEHRHEGPETLQTRRIWVKSTSGDISTTVLTNDIILVSSSHEIIHVTVIQKSEAEETNTRPRWPGCDVLS